MSNDKLLFSIHLSGQHRQVTKRANSFTSTFIYKYQWNRYKLPKWATQTSYQKSQLKADSTAEMQRVGLRTFWHPILSVSHRAKSRTIRLIYKYERIDMRESIIYFTPPSFVAYRFTLCLFGSKRNIRKIVTHNHMKCPLLQVYKA